MYALLTLFVVFIVHYGNESSPNNDWMYWFWNGTVVGDVSDLWCCIEIHTYLLHKRRRTLIINLGDLRMHLSFLWILRIVLFFSSSSNVIAVSLFLVLVLLLIYASYISDNVANRMRRNHSSHKSYNGTETCTFQAIKYVIFIIIDRVQSTSRSNSPKNLT